MKSFKSYTRIEKCDGYYIICDVTDRNGGEYYQRMITTDINGNTVVFNEYRNTLEAMGWQGVNEFLKNSIHGKEFTLTGI